MRGNVGNRHHVAINAHLLSGQAGYRSAGVHKYIYHLLGNLGQSDDGFRYTALAGEGRLPANAAPVVTRSRWPTDNALGRIAWEQCLQPRTLRRIEADLAHGPVFVGPLLSPCPVVLTIHDLSFIRFPALFRPSNRLYLSVFARLSARKARRLIAVSRHAASEARRLLGVPREQIDVVHNGVDRGFRPLPAQAVEAFRSHKHLPERYLLHVGTLEPRKNLIRLVEAFDRACDDSMSLVLAGGKGWYYNEVFAKVEELQLGNRVAFAGYVPDGELPLLYNGAFSLVYPSLYEGFGLPILEALACGTPVLTSTSSSLPEVAGDAALVVDPRDVDDIARGIRQLMVDDTLREELRERGLARAQQFSWQRTAQETARVYGRILSEDRA